jgi:hypothetical protein
VDVGIVASVLEVHAASIFSIDPEQPKNKISIIIEICCDKSKCNAGMGEKGNAYRILVRKLEGK